MEKSEQEKQDEHNRMKARVRLARQVAQYARLFVQTQLPPLRALPTEEEHRRLAKNRSNSLSQAAASLKFHAKGSVNAEVDCLGDYLLILHYIQRNPETYDCVASYPR